MEPSPTPDDIRVARLVPEAGLRSLGETDALARSAQRLREERRRLDQVLAQVERDLGEAQIRVAKLEARFHRSRRQDPPS